MECWATIFENEDSQLYKQFTTWHDYLRIWLVKDIGQPPDCLYCVRQTLRSCMYILNFENCCYRTYVFIERKYQSRMDNIVRGANYTCDG